MKSSHKIALALIISFLVSAVIDSYFLYSRNMVDVTYFLHIAIIGVLLFMWCRAHAKENNIKDAGGKPLFCALLGGVGVPYYAYKCYGFKRGSILLGKAFAALLLALVLVTGIDILFEMSYAAR
ncbi:hypothetical protein I6F65_17625 [Pseudoalteromonas sp. SWXJZ94C]|uniref:hypothetical protein n=1 Tax=unclassified Pseudoalteromonas TaxID=194690 RepID=UPI000464797D|nr:MULTISPECIES: hypothetical protein [unclassified Pseudoalteromonas]MBH0058766.1 hypothetical protein [Pseudoalteromonas sp. SWXJZ94C]